jgi:hypothetical protein
LASRHGRRGSLQLRFARYTVRWEAGVVDPPSFPEQLTEIAFLALDHGIGIVADDCQLTPFALVEDTERTLVRAQGETLDDALAWLRDHVRNRPGLQRAAVTFDGFLTVEGRRTEAVLVEAYERGAEGLVLAQRYEWHGRGAGRRFESIGNPAVVGTTQPLG